MFDGINNQPSPSKVLVKDLALVAGARRNDGKNRSVFQLNRSMPVDPSTAASEARVQDLATGLRNARLIIAYQIIVLAGVITTGILSAGAHVQILPYALSLAIKTSAVLSAIATLLLALVLVPALSPLWSGTKEFTGTSFWAQAARLSTHIASIVYSLMAVMLLTGFTYSWEPFTPAMVIGLCAVAAPLCLVTTLVSTLGIAGQTENALDNAPDIGPAQSVHATACGLGFVLFAWLPVMFYEPECWFPALIPLPLIAYGALHAQQRIARQLQDLLDLE